MGETPSTPQPAFTLSAVQDAACEFGVGGLRRHIFLCRGPDCCSTERGETIWKYLKNRLKALKLSGRGGSVYRSKVDCLRICRHGPIVLVYPEGSWYHQVDEAKMERIIQSHCIQGRSLESEAFAINPLDGGPDPQPNSPSPQAD